MNTVVTERNRKLYDSIQAKTSRRAVPRMLYKILFIKPVLDSTANGVVLDEGKLYKPYADKTIGTIAIIRDNVFNEKGNWFERTGNKIHVITRERIIRRDLLFKSGDPIDPELIVRNKQLLRSRDYLSDAVIELIPNTEDTTLVDIIIRTRDSWTISADAGIHGEGHTMFGLSDANILGWGNELNIKTHFNRNNFDYGGNIFQYKIPNILGTFFEADFSAGRNFYNSELKLDIRKQFIRPTDYELGVNYQDVKAKTYRIDKDTAELVRLRSIDLWAGISRYIKGMKSSIFFTGRYNYEKYRLRPEVSIMHNPVFHNTDNLLLGIGLYREKFYSASMIYGFGNREYLATGYKAELMGGYSWGEFNNNIYLGMGYKTGGFTGMGYLMGGFTLGSYIAPHDGSWNRSAIDIDLRWFSNLFIVRRNRIRQFLSLNYTQGWNRGTGSNELISFTHDNGLQTIREYVTGINRIVLNTETVVFTPYQPLGFRIAVFGFADFGLLGNSANMFKNNFFASFGIGLRIRNERLIFKAIQLRLGIALGKHGLVDSQYFRASNSPHMEQYRYLPTRPEIVGFY